MQKKQVLTGSSADRRQIFRGISGHRSFDFSKTLLHDCNQQTVRNSILALRRGPISYRRNTTIVCEGDPNDYIFLVVKGVVRSCKTFQDGGRRIVAFHFPGELFGWSGDLMHSLSEEAATDTLVLFIKRSALLAAAIQDSRIVNYLLAATTNELRRAQEHSLLISRSAECRVATFLIDLSMRMGEAKYLNLPMSHNDIACHLGLKNETLSRTITALERSGSIARASYRALALRNRASLERMMSKCLLFALSVYLTSLAQYPLL